MENKHKLNSTQLKSTMALSCGTVDHGIVLSCYVSENKFFTVSMLG